MDLDSVGVVLDEIALEGLEGITLPSLWIRLSDTKFSLDTDDELVRSFIWSKIIVVKAASNDLKLFRLPQARKTIQLYNRYNYANPDTGACLENDHVPEDVYGVVTAINDGDVRGSCTTYESRVDVTKTILDKKFTLQDVMGKYGQKLTIVASQKLREYSLRIPCFDPCLPLTPMQYCVLEKVGRARKYGEVTVGKEASRYRDSPKTLFYYRKILLRRGLIKKQQHIISMRQSGQNRIGLVLTLPRFHFTRLMPLAIAAKKTNDFLLDAPENESDFYELQEKVGIKKKLFKAVFANYTKNFSVHEYHEEEANGKKIIRRKVKLIKPVELDADSDDDDDGNDDNDDNEVDIEGYTLKKIRNFALFAKAFDTKRIRVDRQLTTQTLELIDNWKSPEGISLRELGEELRLPKLEIRQLSRVLERSSEVTTIMTDHGKQKIKKYQPIHRINDTKKIFEEEGKSLKFSSNETLTFLRRANLILDAVRKNKIFDELVTFKKLISAAEKDSPFTIDRKSIKTIINKLALHGYIRYIKTLLTCQNKEHKLEIVCDPSITANSPLVRDRIETNKFRLFGASGEDAYANRAVKKSRNTPVSSKCNSKNLECELKYKPSVARHYGYEPKMSKLMTLYKFLFHVMCVRKSGGHKDWRKHIPELILDSQGSCTLGDIIPRIPLSIFVKIVFIHYVIPELEDYLNDPNRRNLTLFKLPADFRRKLMFKRKYIFNIFEELVSLTHMNLVKLDYTDTCSKETAKITIITSTSFMDFDDVKSYDFHTLSDVERFINDLMFHCSQTTCTNCSLDPRLFAHNQRNWTYSPSMRSSFSVLRSNEENNAARRLKSGLIGDLTNDPTDPNRMRLLSLRSKNGLSRKRLHLTNQLSIQLANNTSKENFSDQDGIVPKRKKVQKKPAKNKTIIEKVKEPRKRLGKPSKFKRRVVHDETDIKAIKMMKKRRVHWNKEEDSFLLMCRIASILLDPTCPTFVCVSGSLIRDELHKYLPEISMDKTIKACQRRLNYMLKKNRTRENVMEWVSDVKQEIDSLNIGRPSTPKTDTEAWSEAFLKYLHILLTKFQAYHLSISSTSDNNLFTTYETLDELKSHHEIIESHTSILPVKPDLYKEPENIVDMCVYVIQNVITSTLMYNTYESNEDSAGNNYSHTLFKIYQGYPDILIRSVVSKLSKNRVMTKIRRVYPTSSFASRGLAPYKISQAYLFKLKTKFGMDSLPTPIDNECVTIVDKGSRCQASIVVSLFAANQASFTISIPDNFVFIDKSKLENRSTRPDLNANSASSFTTDPVRTIIEDPKMASRFALHCFREKLTDETYSSKQHPQDYLAIKSCPVTCTSKNITLDLNSFAKLLKKEEMRKPDIRVQDNCLIHQKSGNFIKFIEQHREFGVTREDIINFHHGHWPDETIEHLTSTGEIYQVGVMFARFVHYDYVDHWLVHSIDYPEGSDKPQSIRFVPKLWKDAYGNVHRKILFRYLSFVLSNLFLKPGISEDALFADLSDILPPAQILDLIQFLQSINCVEVIKVKERGSFTLFADEDDNESYDDKDDGNAVNKHNLKTVNYYQATAQAFTNLCQTMKYLDNLV